MQLRQTAIATKIADANNQTDEDGWTYRAVTHAERPEFAWVEVYDEDGELVGRI